MAERERIPADLHEEILHLLPSNDLLNFTSVCKDWNELISSQRFIQKHLRRSNRTRIVTLSNWGILVYDDHVGSNILKTIPYPPGFCSDDTEIAGSCDGVICLVREKDKAVGIMNPSTGKCDVRRIDGFVLDEIQGFWFGRHPSTGEYLFVARKICSNIITVHRFSSKLTTSLQRCSIPPIYYCFDKSPILLHGALHWLAHRLSFISEDLRPNYRPVVLAYDIEENEIMEISTPNFEDFATLGVIDGCLFAILEVGAEELEFWIMKEYGVEESWTKHSSLNKCKVGYSMTKYGVEESWAKHGSLEECRAGFLPDLQVYDFAPVRFEPWHVYRVDSENYISGNNASVVFCADSLVSPALIWGN